MIRQSEPIEQNKNISFIRQNNINYKTKDAKRSTKFTEFTNQIH